MYDIQHCIICCPSDSTVSEDARIESRTVATTALAVRRSYHSGRSHPQSARSHTHSARSHTHSARSHPQLGYVSSNNSARSKHPHSARSHPHTARSHPHSARSHPHSARSHPHSARSHNAAFLLLWQPFESPELVTSCSHRWNFTLLAVLLLLVLSFTLLFSFVV